MTETQAPHPRSISIAERDLRWTLAAAAIEPLLFDALQADALGAIDALTLADLNPRIHASILQLLTLRSEQAVRSMSTTAVSEARRQTRIAFLGLAEEAERNAIFASATTMQDRTVARQAIQSFRRMLEGCSGSLSLVEWVIDTYDRALVAPITLSPRAQEARAALTGVPR